MTEIKPRRKKAFAYLRVSGKKQVGGHGFKRQLETIQAYCDANNYKLIKVFRDQVSGVKEETDRPQFSEMIAEILANHCSTVIIESLDRLAREYRVQEHLIIYLASKGITLIAANTGEDITAAIQQDPMRKALVQIQGIFAELDKSTLSLRLWKGRERKRQTDPWKPGPKPYGQNPDERKALDIIVSMRPDKTLQKIADELNSQGILSQKGKEWTAHSVAQVYKTFMKNKDSENKSREFSKRPYNITKED